MLAAPAASIPSASTSKIENSVPRLMCKFFGAPISEPFFRNS
jgi:hypothetical protein